MKRTSPIKMQICATLTRLNIYEIAPIHRNKMPNSKPFETKRHPHRKIVPFVVVATIIILTIYYLPNYLFLERATADHTAFLLNSLGISVHTKIVNDDVFLADMKIVKDCTGVQVLAVLFGILIPIPNTRLMRKILTLAIVSILLYVANVLRIALEFCLVYFNLLPWVLAHYPLSLLLGILGVFVLVLVTDLLLPEFGDFIFSLTRMQGSQTHGRTMFG